MSQLYPKKLNHIKLIIMFKANEYFEGKVASLALEGAEGNATVGVMAAGEYEFGTASVEIMTVISGEMAIRQPGETEYTTYKKSESFTVAKDVRFGVKVTEDTPYFCVYK